jgi:DNA topoisomerase II
MTRSYLDDDGQKVEPRYYVPIIPMVLVNGIQGIGTGWSTSIPPHHPLELIKVLKSMLAGKEPLSETINTPYVSLIYIYIY